MRDRLDRKYPDNMFFHTHILKNLNFHKYQIILIGALFLQSDRLFKKPVGVFCVSHAGKTDSLQNSGI